MTKAFKGKEPKKPSNTFTLSRRCFVTGASAAAMIGLVSQPASTQQNEELIIFTDAKTLANRIRTREVSVFEVMEQFLDQIERINPHVNAYQHFDRALNFLKRLEAQIKYCLEVILSARFLDCQWR